MSSVGSGSRHAVRLVFCSPGYVALGIVSFAAMLLLYLWSSQVITVTPIGLAFLIEPLFIVAAFVLASLFGLLVPLQVYAFRLAAASVKETGGTVVGLLLGTASMSCCAPLLLPPLLSLVGFSGTALLSFNSAVSRFWLPLATLSAIFLLYSLVSVVHSLETKCRVDPHSRHSLQTE